VAYSDFEIFEAELWNSASIVGLLAVMRRHVLTLSNRLFLAILEPSQGGHLHATGSARHHYKYSSIMA
jgi:hypothetical protein